jgi:hypothetical protein
VIRELGVIRERMNERRAAELCGLHSLGYVVPIHAILL